MLESIKDRQKLPLIYGAVKLLVRSKAGNDLAAEMSSPVDIRGVGPQVELGTHLL